MATEGEVRKELDSLLAGFDPLLKLATAKDIVGFGLEYQKWYSRALKLVELLGPDRLEEFRAYYLADPKRKSYDVVTYTIQDFIKGHGATTNAWDKPQWDIYNLVGARLMNQLHILESLSSRLGTVLADVKGHLLAEIEDEELQVATRLLKINIRAAGALTGVVLESHLQRVAENHKIAIGKKNPTISDLNDPLRNAGVYDMPTWRRIQHLADIRNLCDHKKQREPKEEEVQDLIAGVSSVIRNVH